MIMHSKLFARVFCAVFAVALMLAGSYRKEAGL